MADVETYFTGMDQITLALLCSRLDWISFLPEIMGPFGNAEYVPLDSAEMSGCIVSYCGPTQGRKSPEMQ